MKHQELGQVRLHLVHRGLLVKLGKPGQSVVGDEPDFPAFRIDDADKNQRNIDIAGVQIADTLLVERHSFLRGALGLIADLPQVAGKGAIDHNFQLGSGVFSLALTPGSGHLQILRRNGIVSRLCRLEKSIQGAAGRVASERIGCGCIPIAGSGR